MREKGIDEDCIHQIYRLFSERLSVGNEIIVDSSGFIRLDDLEMREDVQVKVNEVWAKLNDDNLRQLTDLEGYHKDFLKLFGFGLDGVNYDVDVDPNLRIPSLV